MNHVTELIVEEVKIEGGAQIIVQKLYTPNKTLFNGLFFLGKLLRWMMECKSNDMTRGLKPRDVRAIWALWVAHKADFKSAQANSDAPEPVHNINRLITLPHPKEMMRYKNLKISRVAQEIHDYCHTCMGVDSSHANQIVTMADYQDIVEAQRIAEDVMTMFMGTGQRKEDGSYDTGMDLPAMSALGREVPDGDLDFMIYGEPSKIDPRAGLPDAPDTPPDTKPHTPLP